MKGARCVLGVVLVTVGVPVLCGCLGGLSTQSHEMVVERQVNLDGRTVGGIPFRAPEGQYFESPDGSELADRVLSQMRLHMPATRFASALGVREKLQGDKLSSATPEDLGKAAGADVVMVGVLKEMRTQEPKTTGILRGTCNADVSVYDAKTGKEIAAWSVNIQYPQLGAGIPTTDTTPEKVRDAVLKRAADFVAKKFYTYKQKTMEPAIDW
jgi:hypothetical protein